MTASNAAIRVEGLGKRYRIGRETDRREGLLQSLRGYVARPFEYLLTRMREPDADEILWALKDVSFEVQPGEVLGVVGRNGSGKSTLLKILSRITEPTEGEALLKGRVGSLLEVGTGFHPELTGRENVYMNGAILGMRKREVDRKFDEILHFAGVERMIDTPVKRYSSGQRVRLGFSVAAHLETDVLLVDEVLSVGDAGFRRKCVGKMESITSQGRTILFVSHNMEALLGICTRAIWLDSGAIKQTGSAQEVVGDYLAACYGRSQVDLGERTDRAGSGRVRFTGIKLLDGQGQAVSAVAAGSPLEILLSVRTEEEALRGVSLMVVVKDRYQRALLRLGSRHSEVDFGRLEGEVEVVCRLEQWPLASGTFTIDVMAWIDDYPADIVDDATEVEGLEGDFFGLGAPPVRHLVGEFLAASEWSLKTPDA